MMSEETKTIHNKRELTEDVKAFIIASGIEGVSAVKIAEELGVGRTWVLAQMKKPEIKTAIEFAKGKVIEDAKLNLKGMLAKMSQEAVRVILSRLEKDDLNAATLVLRTMGVLNEEQQQTNSQPITVILPGANQPKTIPAEVKNVDSSDGSV